MNADIQQMTIGCDPEFFMIDNTTGCIVSSIGKINGTKEEPLIAPNGASMHYDNIAFEMALPISKSKEQWLNVNSASFKLADAMIPRGYSLSLDISSANVSEDELLHPDALVFGCSGDLNAYTMKANMAPVLKDKTFRCVGGHIHVGHEVLGDYISRLVMCRVMDCLHGVISTELDHNEGSKDRRKLYGKAGSYRATDYGIEYRVLSNYWMGNTLLQELMWLLTRDALQIIIDEKQDDLFALFTDLGEDVQEIINDDRSSFIIWMEEYRKYLGDDTSVILEECLYTAL